jgi:hypothetical protein
MPVSHSLKKVFQSISSHKAIVVLTICCLLVLVIAGVLGFLWYQTDSSQKATITTITEEKAELSKELLGVSAKLTELENEDQKVRNDQLQQLIGDLSKANADAVKQYERLLNLKEDGANVEDLEKKWASILALISTNNYSSASATLAILNTDITAAQKKLAEAAALKIPQAALNNQPPTAGYQIQRVETSAGQITVSLVAGDLGSTRVIVDTASGSDCKNDCPVLSLGDYVGRNGAYAGINGSYFCPASYPSCADKKNSFDLLVMNKDKTYFNSDNNIYSTNPAVIFQGGSVRFVGQASQWGRDTGIDSMLSNYPLLLSGGEVRFGGDDDPKKGSKGNRSFVANKGNTVYIGVVHGATVAEAALALKALGMENAMNLDSGGSTALWAGGYKVGPGRAIPNAILFVRR